MYEFENILLNIRSGFKKLGFIRLLIDVTAFSAIIYGSILLVLGNYLDSKYPVPPVQYNILLPAISLAMGILLSITFRRKDKKLNILSLIEQKYPQLKEKLKTAYDNRTESNIIVEDLANDVSSGLAGVRSGALISKGVIAFEILLAISAMVGTVYVSENQKTIGVNPATITNLTDVITGASRQNRTEGIIDLTGMAETKKRGVGDTGEIFGKPKIESIEGKTIDITLYPTSGTGFTIRDAGQTREEPFIQSPDFPVDIRGGNVSDSEFAALLRKTQLEKDLIDRYAIERSKL